MRWKQIFPTWLILFLIAPSIWIHGFLMIGGRPPEAEPFIPPLFVPFGIIEYGGDLWKQLARGDFIDALIIFIFLILPILIYTFILSVLISFSFEKVRSRR